MILHTIRQRLRRTPRWSHVDPRWPWIALALLIGWFGIAGGWTVVRAATAALPSASATLVVPAIAHAPRTPQAHGIFYRQTLALTLPMAFWLASSPDGQGPLCTDDQATLTFAVDNQPVQRWAHRFTSADRRSITCLRPQLITVPAPGAYQITVELEDLYPDTYGTHPYYLVAAGTDSPVQTAATAPVAADMALATVSPAAATPAPTRTDPTMPSRPGGAAGSNSAARSVEPPTRSPQAAVTAEPTRLDTTSSLANGERTMALLIGAAVLIGVLTMALLRQRARRRASATTLPIGIVDLFDQETREARTALLSSSMQGAEVRRGPLRLVLLPTNDRDGTGIARILPTERGVLLQEMPAAAPVDQPQLLLHDTAYYLAGGVVTLRYRDQSTGRAVAAAAGRGQAAPVWESRKD